MSRRARARAAAALAIAALAAACGEPASDDSGDVASAGFSTVTFRLWDEAAAAAYRESFDAFNAITRDVHVEVEVVPEESYAKEAAADLADGTMADIFWTTSDAVAAHAHGGHLVELGEALGEDHEKWEPAVTELFTRDDGLWAVPQLWDSTVLFYNTELVDRAGVDPATLTWDPAVVGEDPAMEGSGAQEEPAEPQSSEAQGAPEEPAPPEDGEPGDQAAADPPTDTLRQAVRDLTRDHEGRTAAEEGFDHTTTSEYGFNTDLTEPAVWLPFVTQVGAPPQDALTLTGPEVEAAFEYLAALPVAPPVDTATPARELFTSGQLAMFQSTSADLRQVAEHAQGDWGLAPVPAGPEGAVAVAGGIGAAANAASANPEATAAVLRWIASTDGQTALASHGIAVPAATGAQDLYLRAWADRGIDVTPALRADAVVTAVTGPRAQEVLESVRPILGQLFRGELPVSEALATAQETAEERLSS